MLGELIPEPKPRSKAWLSTSFPLDSDDSAAAACGPDYHVLPPLAALPNSARTSCFVLKIIAAKCYLAFQLLGV